MRKVLLIVIGLLLVGCSTQQVSEFDQELEKHIETQKYKLPYSNKDSLFWSLDSVENGFVYFTRWIDVPKNNLVSSGILKVGHESQEELLNTVEEGVDILSFLEQDEGIYYAGFTPSEVKVEDQVNYNIYLKKNDDIKQVVSFEKEVLTHYPIIFEMNGRVFVTACSIRDGEEYFYIYNISEDIETFKLNLGEHEIPNGIYGDELQKGLEKDKLVFTETKEIDEILISTLYIFNGRKVEQMKYKDIAIKDAMFIQDTLVFLYGDNLNKDEEKHLGFIDENENLVKTDINAHQINKVLDVKGGAIIEGSLYDKGFSDYYIEIKDHDVELTETAVIEDVSIRRRTLDGFIIRDTENKDEEYLKYYLAK